MFRPARAEAEDAGAKINAESGAPQVVRRRRS